MFTTIKVVSRHEDTQLYGAILLDELTNEAINDSKSYKEYYAIASGAEPPKTKASVKKKQTGSDMTKTPPTAKGKRLKTSAKTAKPAKNKQPVKMSKAKGLTMLSEVTLTEAEQMELAIKRSMIQTFSSHASGLGTNEGTSDKPGVPDVPTYASYDEQISLKSSDEEYDDEVAMSGDDDDDADNQDDDDDQNDDNTDNENDDNDDDDDGQDHEGANIEGDEMDKEETSEEEEMDELYRDVNVNLEGRDTKMTDAPRIIIQTTQVIEDTHVIITPVNPEGQQQSSSMSSGFVSNMLNSSPDTVPTPTTVPSSSLQDLPNFGSLFGFDHRLKTLENDFSKFNQTNQFAVAVSSIPEIVDTYLANKMNEAVKTAIQLQSDRLRDKAQAENEDFLNKLDDNIKKIIKDQVKDQVKAQVSKILPKIKKTVNEKLEAELKKILIDKMESNKSIHISDEQKNFYKALVDAYESDKLILDTYGDNVSFKRCRDDEDKDEEPSDGSNWGSKRRRAGKELKSTSAPKEKTSKIIGKSTEGSKSHHESAHKSTQEEEPMHTTEDLEEPAHQEFVT
ncbi:hypothetical protein Tco_0289840 [Tanacetum coccineum]